MNSSEEIQTSGPGSLSTTKSIKRKWVFTCDVKQLLSGGDSVVLCLVCCVLSRLCISIYCSVRLDQAPGAWWTSLWDCGCPAVVAQVSLPCPEHMLNVQSLTPPMWSHNCLWLNTFCFLCTVNDIYFRALLLLNVYFSTQSDKDIEGVNDFSYLNISCQWSALQTPVIMFCMATNFLGCRGSTGTVILGAQM